MSALTIGVSKETCDGERRVAIDPAAAKSLCAAGREVLVQTGAGESANFPDSAYVTSGASIVSRSDLIRRSDVLPVVRVPSSDLVAECRPGQTVVGLVDPLNNVETTRRLSNAGVTLVAFELLPRTLSRAQAMDALSSQSSAAGYRAAIVASEAFGRYLAMMITASGASKPAKVMVIGAGVAGLQAIATCHRLGAIVTGYDVRAASRGEVESLGATFLSPSVANGVGTGGYAREMTAEEQKAQRTELQDALVSCDLIITTAKVPDRRPPVLVSEETLSKLRPGSVCVDLGSSAQGGNVAGSIEGQRTVTPEGVTVIGAGELAADLPTSSSQMYARNVTSVIASLYPADELLIDPADEVHKNIVVSHDGAITNDAVRAVLTPASQASSSIQAAAS